jgi:hypothetical protein
MPRGRSAFDPTILRMALVGYEIEKQKVEEKIREIRARLGGGTAAVGSSVSTAAAKPGAARRRRPLSASARQRIADAQRKRWAEHRKKLAQAGKGK